MNTTPDMSYPRRGSRRQLRLLCGSRRQLLFKLFGALADPSALRTRAATARPVVILVPPALDTVSADLPTLLAASLAPLAPVPVLSVSVEAQAPHNDGGGPTGPPHPGEGPMGPFKPFVTGPIHRCVICLLYTSDAADE